MKRLIFFITMLFTSLSSIFAGERGFAIVVDSATYQNCRVEIESYISMLKGEGLSPILLADVWSSPEQVKSSVIKAYKENNIEGVLLLGDIPIAMVRDAQHLTSAFKMDQERFAMNESSVPSDRFYDDFDLKFRFISRDSIRKNLFYYSLSPDSPQYIESDIYSGRIKPTLTGEAGYRQIKDYFNKLVIERSKKNYLNCVTSYTGEGSFSNSLTAWKEEQITMREQIPFAFENRNSSKFLLFYMYPHMKDLVINELKRDDLDLMVFHEHGMPHRQYLTGEPLSEGAEDNYEASKRMFREYLRRYEQGSQKERELRQLWSSVYRIDSSWFEGAYDRDVIVKDSLYELKRGIVIEDLASIKPDARVVIFDACYNGDFREDRFIAGDYIFAGGKTLVSIGNSVNVLQDKSSTDLIGLLSLGVPIGEVIKMTNILESHIIGDPTMRFDSPADLDLDLDSKSADYWLDILSQATYTDVKSLALRKLFFLRYPNMPELLERVYYTSKEYTVRLQVIHLLPHYRGEAFARVLKRAVDDPYEFIRRKAAYNMGKVGLDEFIPYVATLYLNSSLDERVWFNTLFAFDMLDIPKVKQVVFSMIDSSSFIFDKQRAKELFEYKIASKERLAKSSLNLSDKSMSLKERLFAVSFLRNNNYHTPLERYLKVLSDSDEDVKLRIKLAEALGWYTYSWRKGEIVDCCRNLLSKGVENPMLEAELIKCINRLETYMR